MLKVLTLIPVVILSAILYRLGGIGKPWNTKVRDMGVPLVCLLWLYFCVSAPWWVWFIMFGMMFGALTTYWDYWGTDNVEWYEWALHMGMVGVALTPLIWFGVPWYYHILRIIVLAVAGAAWSEYIDIDWLEEGGRGFLIAATLPLLLIGG